MAKIFIGSCGGTDLAETEAYVVEFPMVLPFMGLAANGAGKRGTLIVENEAQLRSWATDRFTQYEIR